MCDVCAACPRIRFCSRLQTITPAGSCCKGQAPGGGLLFLVRSLQKGLDQIRDLILPPVLLDHLGDPRRIIDKANDWHRPDDARLNGSDSGKLELTLLMSYRARFAPFALLDPARTGKLDSR